MVFNKKIISVILMALLVLAFNGLIDLGPLQQAYRVAALNNGLAKTPPMGWNSWNVFHGDINETQIKQIADAMVSSGMKDAGYVYLNLDDNWMANPARDANGNLKGDTTRFPSGMKALGDYIHSKGLKFGIYGCRGTMTCMNVSKSGSYGNEQRDANTFASWGVDYLKYDNCNTVGNMQTDYQNMQSALANCGRSIVFSICAWGYQSWMPAIGNLWRTTGDITDKWDNGTNWIKGIINVVDGNAGYASSAAPGAWNDPDMLEIGNGGCTTEEYRTQMSMWSIMAAPLIAGNDIRTMSQTTKDILLNSEVIAVDQDPAGIQGTKVSASNGLEVWCKPLGSANGTTKAVALLNRNGTAASITVKFADIGLSGTVTVRDLWAKADRGSFSGSYTMTVPPHGTGLLKITSTASPTATPTPTVTVTPTPSTMGCSINYSQSDWGSGATVSIIIKNNGSSAINGWTLVWNFAGNQTITDMWNGTYTQSGTAVTVKNVSYNSTIPAKGSVSLGFNITYSGTNAKPASFTLNGTACQLE
jgi:alpha-galactosidase